VTRICPRDPSRRGECNESKDPCTLSVIRPQDSVVTYSNQDLEFRNRQLKYYFNYIRDQSTLRPDFQVDLKQCRLSDLILPEENKPPLPNPGNGNPLPPPGTPPVQTPPFQGLPLPPPTAPAGDTAAHPHPDNRPDSR
jgi:hypothetical protein